MSFCSRSVAVLLLLGSHYVLLAAASFSSLFMGANGRGGSGSEQLVKNEEVLFSTTGRVGAGNYSYYSLQDESLVKLVLTSRVGDADLYVSESIGKPTFELDEHSMSSATCGVDQVTLPKDIGRPVNVAVYGHPNYEVSIYRLDVVSVEEEEDLYDQFTLYIDEEEQNNRREKEETKTRSKSRARDKEDSYYFDEDDETLTLSGVIWSVVKGVLHILLEILL